MKVDILFRVTLRRSSANTPWGFRLSGGKQVNESLIFREVYPNSIADNCGLQEGDKLVVLAGHTAEHMNIEETQGIITNAGNVLEIIIERPHPVADTLLESRSTFPGNVETTFLGPTEKPSFTAIKSSQIPSQSPYQTNFFKTNLPMFSDSNFKVHQLTEAPNKYFSPPSNWMDQADKETDDVRDRYLRNVADEVKRAIANTPPRKTIFPRQMYFDDDFVDKTRKVRFAEPIESSIMDLRLNSSRAASVDPDFLGTARFSYPMFPTHGSPGHKQFQSFSNISSPRREYSSNVMAKRFGGVDPEQATFSKPESTAFDVDLKRTYQDHSDRHWSFMRNDHPFRLKENAFPSGFKKMHDTFKTDLTMKDNVKTKAFPLTDIQKGIKEVPSMLQSNSFFKDFADFPQQDPHQLSSNVSTRRTFTSSGAALPGRGLPELMDMRRNKKLPADVGLFAVLDKSFADKLMEEERPINFEQSATLKLVRERENEPDDRYHY